MSLRLLVLTFFTGCFSFVSNAQKKVIDHTAYNDWKRIGETTLSNNGEYSAYTITPYKGDGYLYLVNNTTGKKDSVPRGKNPQFTYDGSILVYRIVPKQEALHKAELDKLKKEKWPKDSLVIRFLKNDSLVKFANIKSVQIGENSNVIAYLSYNNTNFEKVVPSKSLARYLSYYPALSTKKSTLRKAQYYYLVKRVFGTNIDRFTSSGTTLNVLNLETNTTAIFPNVSSFEMDKTGSLVSFIESRSITQVEKRTQKKTELKDSLRLFVYNSKEHKTWYDKTSYFSISNLNFSDDGLFLLGVFSNDTVSNRSLILQKYNTVDGAKSLIIDSTQKFENNFVLSENYQPQFVNNNSDIFFGVWEPTEIPAKDSLLENEKVKVDIWNWKDERIQPEQNNQLSRDEKKTNLYVHHLSTGKNVALGSDSLEIRVENSDEQLWLLATSEKSYRYKNWESPNASDIYVIDVETGEIKPVLKENHYNASLSPSGRYFSFFNGNTANFMVKDLQKNSEMCATCGNKQNYYSDRNGMPMIETPTGEVGWTSSETGLLIQAEHDIVYFEMETGKNYSFTSNLKINAADTNYNYNIINLNRDSILYSIDQCILIQFNELTKASRIFQISGSFQDPSFQLIDGSDHSYVGFKKAKNAAQLIYQKHSNSDYPDLYTTNSSKPQVMRISNANPQQAEYNWSTVELINWKSYSGIQLEGLLYKPENFDPNKSYPLLVYFYEMYSDELHNHYAPKPTASIIFPTEYASAGYVVLIPDIRYSPGHPANGAYDCIMSATDAALKKYPNLDSTRMGLQGQSWGGYQTAQLITMTDRYKVAMAGAPVSNMFSAYGGIRWGSGFSRQFQYEHTQSRIGKTIWEAPELYVENSPLFHLPKVVTPLLIMANDEDGAVPWYQGIELYMGLRRLQKPVWLLNYNGDDHNLMKPANRMELSIRMRQYFDYYLLNAEAPKWLVEGIPAVDKGIGIQFDNK